MKTIQSPVLEVGRLTANLNDQAFICRDALCLLFGLPRPGTADDYTPHIILELSRKPLPGSKPVFFKHTALTPQHRRGIRWSRRGIRWSITKLSETACGHRTYAGLTDWLRRRGIKPKKWTRFYIRAIYA